MGLIRGELANVGVTEPQWRALRVLQEEGPQESSPIAERACLLLPSRSRILKKNLEDKKQIFRRKDLKNHRHQIVEIQEYVLANIHASLPKVVQQQAEHTGRYWARFVMNYCWASSERFMIWSLSS